MRYLKSFESSKIDIKIIENEIEDISYILEDEGYVVKCGVVFKNTKNDNLGPFEDTLWIMILNVFDKNKLIDSEAFLEFLDRLDEILIKYNINKKEMLGKIKGIRYQLEFVPGRYYSYRHTDSEGMGKQYLLNYRFNT